jgi:hypothetical protein
MLGGCRSQNVLVAGGGHDDAALLLREQAALQRVVDERGDDVRGCAAVVGGATDGSVRLPFAR